MTKYDEVQVIAKAIKRGEPTYKGHKLPTPQTNGTAMQRDTYAMQKAEQVYNSIY